MRITSWARLAPTLSPYSLTATSRTISSVRNTVSTMAASPSWANLLSGSIAKHKGDPTAKYCQLATAGVGGGASCRTWVFRGFWEDTGALKFITDNRSEKIEEIEADSRGEVNFYLRKTREQFRVKGRLQIIGPSETDEKFRKARKHQWSQTSPGSQSSFDTTSKPGEELNEEEEEEVEAKCEESKPPKEPVDNFCLVLMWPQSVDHLELKDGQRRRQYEIEGEFDGGGMPLKKGGASGAPVASGDLQKPTWKSTSVNP